MKPVIKYQGGKTKELPLIKQLVPEQFFRIVEPFCGGAAVSLNYDHSCVLNDINPAAINLYKVIASKDYPALQSRIDTIKSYDHDALEQAYYAARDVINHPGDYSRLVYAISYIVVRQLCFSGMERYNAKGEFNVPFGHYKKFSCNLSPEHHQFFSTKVELREEDGVELIHHCDSNDFIFLDPPYLDRLGYTTGDGGNDLHDRLIKAMKSTKARWLFIHTDCEYYRDNLSEFNIQTEEFQYAQNFGKGKDHSGAKVKHIYVKNY